MCVDECGYECAREDAFMITCVAVWIVGLPECEDMYMSACIITTSDAYIIYIYRLN